MIEPLTIAILYAITEVAKACTISAVAGGVVSNTSDRVLCRVVSATVNHFVENSKDPNNEDLLKGVLDAYTKAFGYYAETINSQATARDRPIADKIVALAKRGNAVSVVPTNELIACITPLIGSPGKIEVKSRSTKFVDEAVSALVKNIEEEIRETLPTYFVELLTKRAPNNRESWEGRLRYYLAETIKDETRFGTRFKNIFIANNIAELVGHAVTTQELTQNMDASIGKLHGKMDSVKSDTEQILALQGQPKELLEQRCEFCLNGNFEAAADCAERAAILADLMNDEETQEHAIRCVVRDLADHIIISHLDDSEAKKFKSKIERHLTKLRTLSFPRSELALEEALFARLDKRPNDALEYAETATTESDNPDTVAEAFMVTL